MVVIDERAEAVAPPQVHPFALLTACLDQLAEIVDAASDAHYVMKPVGVVDSSLGGHIRHCLDHAVALCRGVGAGCIDYDARERGTPIETCRVAALSEIRTIQDQLAQLREAPLQQPLRVRAIISGDGWSIETASSLGRELVFVLSHTIHHNALIAAMCKTLGIPTPARFGYAPATIAYLGGAACVR